MNRKYYNLNTCVSLYKSAETEHKKSEAFEAILGHLSHHIGSMIDIIKGIDSEGHIEVKSYMLSNMKRTIIIRDNAEAQLFFQTMARDMSIDDVRQMIYLEVLSLIRSYRYEKTSFLQYITYLLPLRIASKLVSVSKDAMSQFATSEYPAIADEEDSINPLFDSMESADYSLVNKYASLGIVDILEGIDTEFVLDMADGISDEATMKKYRLTLRDIRDYKKSINARIRNLVGSAVK